MANLLMNYGDGIDQTLLAHLGGVVDDFGSMGSINSNYLMRAYDTTLTVMVYWNATSLDSLGIQYTGPGPLTDIVLIKLLQ